jgi:NAD(P)H-dependent FMN reductase
MRGSSGGDGGTGRVAVLSGSPVAGSRTWSLAAAVGERLAAAGAVVS